MSQIKIGSRYAKALFRTMKQEAVLEYWPSFAGVIKELFEVESARKVLDSPVMPPDLKRSLLNYAVNAADPNIQKVLQSFNDCLVEAGRASLWPDISRMVQELLDHNNGIQRVDLISPVNIQDEIKQNIQKQLESLLKCRVIISQSIDPSLIAGFIICVGNQKMDFSVKRRLDNISRLAVG